MQPATTDKTLTDTEMMILFAILFNPDVSGLKMLRKLSAEKFPPENREPKTNESKGSNIVAAKINAANQRKYFALITLPIV